MRLIGAHFSLFDTCLAIIVKKTSLFYHLCVMRMQFAELQVVLTALLGYTLDVPVLLWLQVRILLSFSPLGNQFVCLCLVAHETNKSCMARVITALHNYTPSSFGKEFQRFVGKEELSLVSFHRDPNQAFSFPSSLAIPLIGEYFDEINSVALEEEDYLAARKLCGLMMGGYTREEDRKDVGFLCFLF